MREGSQNYSTLSGSDPEKNHESRSVKVYFAKNLLFSVTIMHYFVKLPFFGKLSMHTGWMFEMVTLGFP